MRGDRPNGPGSRRVPLKILNAAQLAAVTAAALLVAWAGLAFGTAPSLDAERAAVQAGARALADSLEAQLRGGVADARNLALLLQLDDPARADGDRSALLQDWLALNPRYREAALIGIDGSVRAATDRRRVGSSVARQPWFARARLAQIALATGVGEREAPLDIVLSAGAPGRSDRIQLRTAPEFFTETAEHVRQALGLAGPVAFTVTGADGRVLAGPAASPEGERLAVSVPLSGGSELASPGWVVTATAPAPAARTALPLPDVGILILGLATVLAAAGIGYGLGGRAAQPLRSLAEGTAEPEAEPASVVREIAALTEAVTERSRSSGALVAQADVSLDRIKGRLRTFEAVSGWRCWEIDPDTRQILWSDAEGAGAFTADHASDVAACFDPADHALLHHALTAVRAEGGPHDVVLRTRADAPEGQRRMLVRFLRGGTGDRIHALSRALGEAESPEPGHGRNERRHALVLRQVTDAIIHDFNDALTVVLANLGVLRRRPDLDAAQSRLVEAALAGALRGAALTRRMLNLVRGEADASAESDPGAAIGAALAFMQTNVLRDMPVIDRLPAGLPRVLCAERLIEITLLNIAFHIRDQGLHGFAIGGAEHEAQEALAFGLPAGRYVRLLVASGQRVPDRLPSAAPSRTSLETVAALLAEIGAGWRLLADGTGEETFLAEIWLRAAERPAAEPPLWQASLRILLVESDGLVRESLAEALTDLGHEVVQAATGAQALDLLSEDARFDTMIADQAMPVMSGLQLVATVVERYPGIRVVLASPHGQLPATARRFLQLDKPFRPDELATVLSAGPVQDWAA